MPRKPSESGQFPRPQTSTNVEVPHTRRLSITLTGPLLSQLEAAARRSGASVQDLLRIGASQMLDGHERRVKDAQARMSGFLTQR